jgi:hypothetical protein
MFVVMECIVQDSFGGWRDLPKKTETGIAGSGLLGVGVGVGVGCEKVSSFVDLMPSRLRPGYPSHLASRLGSSVVVGGMNHSRRNS